MKKKQESLSAESEGRKRGVECYKSTLLNRYFDDYEALVEAEEAYERENAEKIRQAEERRTEAKAVKDAITARIEAELEAREAKREAYRAYLEACDKADADVNERRKAENGALEAFLKKHPEGFRDTIKVGDVEYKVDYNATTYVDPFLRLLRMF